MADIKLMDIIPKKIDLAYDNRQWVLRRYGGIAKKTGEENWAAVKFITTRSRLALTMMEMGVPKSLALDVVAKLPTTHAEFMGDLNE